MRDEQGVTIVTGGASGMGEATAALLVAAGRRVLMADIQDDRGEQIARRLGPLAAYLHANVMAEDDVAGLLDHAVSEFGRVDGLFNNAGIIGTTGPIDQTPVEEWDFTVEMLLRSVFLGLKHGARVMKPAERGAIVNTASIASFRGDIGPHAYTAAKSGVVGLTRSAAAELGAWGIRVNAVAPGRMATPMVAAAWVGDVENLEGAKEAIGRVTPLKGRIGLASDIAEAAVWLLSDAAGYVSGQTLIVDGGLVAGSPPAATGLHNSYSDRKPFLREGGAHGLPNRMSVAAGDGRA